MLLGHLLGEKYAVIVPLPAEINFIVGLQPARNECAVGARGHDGIAKPPAISTLRAENNVVRRSCSQNPIEWTQRESVNVQVDASFLQKELQPDYVRQVRVVGM